MFRTLLIAIALISSSAATAAPAPGAASLVAPAEIARIITEAGSWACSGTACAGPADSVTSVAVAVCTALADRAGRITAFSAGATAFGDAELKRCNRHIKA
jgi:hypothetical protein